MTWKLTKPLLDEIYRYAQFQPSGVSLRQMVNFGQNPSPGSLFRASQFIVEELPIRLAHRVKELDNLPLNLNKSPSILLVKNWYAQSFEELTGLPKPQIDPELKKILYAKLLPNGGTNAKNNSNNNNHQRLDYNQSVFSDDGIIIKHHHGSTIPGNSVINGPIRTDNPTANHLYNTSYSNKKYYVHVPNDIVWPAEVYAYNNLVTDTLTKIKKRHDPTVATIAKGVLEWKALENRADVIDSSIQAFLDRFYLSRIGIRMLIGQHIALNKEPVRNDFVGIICKNTNVGELSQDAIDNARFICEQYYGLYEAPNVELYCNDKIEFMYVPSHLIHMLFEILKNSLRATVEFSIAQAKAKAAAEGTEFDIYNVKFKPIKVIVAEGNEDITIKISDEGGGIPRSAMPLIWTYLYTTAKDVPDLDNDVINNHEFIAPMAGLGYGISLSRLYAKYFGGDLKLISMEGYGTDAYLHLNKLGSSSEPLP